MTDIDIISAALILATTAHGETGVTRACYHGKEPYIAHPIRVWQRVAAWGGNSDEQVAALLHDVVEDTEYGYFAMHKVGVSTRSMELVELLTRRNARNGQREQYLTAFIHRITSDRSASLVKLADLYDNLASLQYRPRGDQNVKTRYDHAVRNILVAWPDLSDTLRRVSTDARASYQK